MRLLRVTVVFALLAGICFSPNLWFGSGRHFPLLPFWEKLPVLSPTTSNIMLALFAIGILTWVWMDRIVIGVVALLSLIIVVLQDQMRWQPWVYLYVLLLIVTVFAKNKDNQSEHIVKSWQWILAGVYVWSGIQKLNPAFFLETFGLIATTLNIEPIKEVACLVPLVEVATGIGLLTARTRKVAVVAAILTHCIILWYLANVKGTGNSVVYPWNIAMVIMVVQVFWFDKSESFSIWKKLRLRLVTSLVAIAIWLLPVLNLFGWWDHYLSFSLYSGKPSEYYIAIADDAVKQIPDYLVKYFVKIPGLEGGSVVSVQQWAMQELNVPFYPEERTFKQLSDDFCKLGIAVDKVVYVEIFFKNEAEQFKTFTCPM